MKNRCNKKAESQRDIILHTTTSIYINDNLIEIWFMRNMNLLDITLAAIFIVLEKHFGFNVKFQVISGAK